MAVRKPLTLIGGVLQGLPSGDTILASSIEQDSTHQMITAVERAAIGTGGGGGTSSFIISDTQPTSPLPGVSIVWMQTNVDGDPESVMFWLLTGE